MGDFNQVPTTAINPLISGETKKRGGLDFRVYQDLKTGIHRDLLNKVDLVGIPVKVNADSGGKPNGIPERR
ncbi:MAG: hypothetical protein WCF26_00135 [Candidatus Sulfotelmatobacter sp.]